MILSMYITTAPVIFAGILDNLFTKSSLYKKLAHPIDGGKCWKDGKRILGDNKTYAGFWSMIWFCIISQIIFGLIYKNTAIVSLNDFYKLHENTLLYNLFIGFLTGLAYVTFELPNSFIKRRIGIKPGKTQRSLIGLVFALIDQIDSLIGVMLIIYIFSDISFAKYLGYVALGGLTHLVLNIIMIALKLRRKP